jgi:hypothetical protein
LTPTVLEVTDRGSIDHENGFVTQAYEILAFCDNPYEEWFTVGFDYANQNEAHIDTYFMWTQCGTNQIPVPAAVWLLGSGLVGLAGLRRKFRN